MRLQEPGSGISRAATTRPTRDCQPAGTLSFPPPRPARACAGSSWPPWEACAAMADTAAASRSSAARARSSAAWARSADAAAVASARTRLSRAWAASSRAAPASARAASRSWRAPRQPRLPGRPGHRQRRRPDGPGRRCRWPRGHGPPPDQPGAAALPPRAPRRPAGQRRPPHALGNPVRRQRSAYYRSSVLCNQKSCILATVRAKPNNTYRCPCCPVYGLTLPLLLKLSDRLLLGLVAIYPCTCTPSART